MLTVRYFTLAVLAVLLISCVSINDKPQLLSGANAKIDTNKIESCQFSNVTNIQIKEVQAAKIHVPNSQSKPVKSLDPEKISLLNWNIYKGNGEGWQEDLAIFSENHDLMTIQEATLEKQFLDILENNGFGWTMNAAFEFNGTTAGVMNVANADSLHSCGFKTTEPIIRIPKSTLISYYVIADHDERLLVANIHGINFTLGLESYNEQLSMLHDEISQHQGPMILAGDFNSWSEERLAEVNKVVKKLSLSKLEYSVNNKTHLFGNAIDHVFYRRLELISNRVMQVSSSDHNPISVSFRVQ